MKEDDNKEELSPEIKKRLEDKKSEFLEVEKLKNQWRAELKNNAEIQSFFSTFNEISVRNFMTTYIERKYTWHIKGDNAQEELEVERTKWIDLAHEHLGYILQKKLFDLQCLWRAEQIKLDGMEISFDFLVAEKNIFNYNFPEPLTMDDVEVYIDYLSQHPVDLNEFTEYTWWQSYYYIKASYSGEEEEENYMPSWYEFNYERTGSGLLMLPNLRGDKEEFYRSLQREPEKEPEKEPEEELSENDKKILEIRNKYSLVGFNFSFEIYLQYMEFIEAIETKEIKEMYDAYFKVNFKPNEENLFERHMQKIKGEILTVPSVAHYDFKEGLLKGYSNFLSQKIIEYLPVAFEQYLFNKTMGIEKSKSDYETHLRVREKIMNEILKGREMNGEPRNLDF